MKTNITFALLASAFASALTVGAAVAAPTAEIKISGVLKTPACNLSFSGGNTVDYGVIPAASLPAGQYKTLDTRSLPFTVTCEAAIKMALKTSDNRADSAVSDAISGSSKRAFGLGAVAGKKVGAYTLTLSPRSLIVDGVSGRLLEPYAGTASWTDSLHGYMLNNGRLSWNRAADYWFGVPPAAFKTVSGAIQVQAILNKPENLPLSQEVPLNGSATLELIYL